MASAPFLTKHLQQTYDAVQAVKTAMQDKLDSLNNCQPFYTLQEDAIAVHTYSELVADTLVLEGRFSSLVAAMLDWDISGITIAEALNILRANQKPPTPTITALCAMPAVATDVGDCADLVCDLYNSIAVFRSRAAPAAIKRDIKDRMGYADTSRHLEVPYISIAKQYNAAFKEIKVLSKWLLDLEKDKTSIRKQLQFKQSMVALAATGSAPTTDTTIEMLLKL